MFLIVDRFDKKTVMLHAISDKIALGIAKLQMSELLDTKVLFIFRYSFFLALNMKSKQRCSFLKALI